MNKKIVIVGGVAGGASAAARIRRLDEHAEIIMFEKGSHVSFSNCSLPFHLSGIVESSEKLVLMNPTSFKNKYDIEARIHSEVISINREQKTVTVKNVDSQEVYEEDYDYLILSPGAKPIIPPIDGVSSPHVFTIRNVTDIEHLQQYITNQPVENIAVIGGGFIGVEVAENLRLAGRNVSLVEFAPQIMTPFDEDMVQILHKEMIDKGVQLIVNDGLANIQHSSITLQSGKQIQADVVVLAIGVQPETSLAKDTGLAIGKLG